MNLKELLKDKKLPVKVRIPSWSSDEYFEVVSFNEYGAVGFFQDGRPYSWIFCKLDAWELYQEQKQKTVLHEYLVASFSSSTFVNYYLKSADGTRGRLLRSYILFENGAFLDIPKPFVLSDSGMDTTHLS
jgi:hypothetical protein